MEDFISNYWTTGRNQVLDFENKMSALIAEHGAMVVFSQIQNYLLSMIKANSQNKPLFYKFMDDMKSVEDAKRQISLTPAMNIQTVVENLSFKMILQ